MDEQSFRRLWEKIIPPEELERQASERTYKGSCRVREDLTVVQFPIVTVAGTSSQAPTVIDKKFSETLGEEEKNSLVTSPTVQYFCEIPEEQPHEQLYEDSTKSTIVYVEDIADESSLSPRVTEIKAESYQIFREIARGGMGVVYRANQLSLKRDIAIKKMLPRSINSFMKEKFIAEALITAYLDHPNIVPVHELGQTQDGEIVLAMKLVKGTSWKELLHPRTSEHHELAQKYDLEAHLQILLSVCNAIAFAHSKEVIHNDIKPENVMVGEFGEVLVMDWGVAVDICQNENQEIRTLHKSSISEPIGTPCYMPPELAEGRGQDIGKWTDIYLLGATLYEIISGSPPHGGSSLWEVLLCAMEGKQPEFAENFPDELKKICSKALAKYPVDRYQSVGEFQKQIEAFLQHRESYIIADDALKILQECENKVGHSSSRKIAEHNQIYSQFAQAIAGFHQALELWHGNSIAQENEKKARFTYAQFALSNEDIGLAESQIAELPKIDPEVVLLDKQIQRAKNKKARLQKTTKRLQWGLIFASVAIIAVLFSGIIIVKNEQRQTEKQKQRVEKQEVAKTQEAILAKIKLAQISLSKASESYDRQEWTQCGVYAGNALGLVESIKQEDIEKSLQETPQEIAKIRAEGKGFVRLALQQHRLLWKTQNRYLKQNYAIFSPYGKTIASASSNNTIQIWDAHSGQHLKDLAGHASEVTHLAFHPQGNILVSGSKDTTVRVWDVANSEETHKFTKHTREVTCVQFHPFGKYIASASLDNSIHIWNINEGTDIKKFQHHGARSIAFDSEGNYLVSCGDDLSIKIWDFRANKLIGELKGHSDEIYSVAFSPDGQTLASASADKTICLWDIPSKTLIKTLAFHEDTVNTVSFSKNGKWLVSASDDYNIVVWDLENNRKSILTGHIGSVYCASFSNDSKYIISCAADKTLQVWDTTTKASTTRLLRHTDEINSIVVSPDSTMFASASDDMSIRVWNIQNGHLLFKLIGHTEAINAIAFSPDGKLLASGSNDHSLRIWNIAEQKETFIIRQEAGIDSVCFDSKWLAFSSDQEFHLWDIEKRQHVRSFAGHTDWITSLAFDSKGTKIASASNDRSVRLWDIATGLQIRNFAGHTHWVNSVTFSPDDSLLMSASSDRTVKVWRITTGELVTNFYKHKEWVNFATFRPDGKIVASASGDNTVILWNPMTGQELTRLIGSGKEIHCVAFSPNGKLLASGGEAVKLWNVSVDYAKFMRNDTKDRISSVAISANNQLGAYVSTSGEFFVVDLATANIKKSSAQQGELLFVAFSPNSENFATAKGNGDITVWQTNSLQQVYTLKGHTEGVKSLAYSPKSDVLASSSMDSTIKLWNLQTQRQIASLTGHQEPVWGIAFNQKGDLLASCSDDKTVRLWSAVTGEELAKLVGHKFSVYSVKFHPNGKLLASASSDETIKIWDLAANQNINTFYGHNGSVNAINFSPDGKILASASSDKTIRLWDVLTGKLVSTLHGHTTSINAISFSSDGKTLISGSDNGEVIFWKITTGHEGDLIEFLEDSTMNFRLDFPGMLIEQQLHENPRKIVEQLFEWKIDSDFSVQKFPQYFLWD